LQRVFVSSANFFLGLVVVSTNMYHQTTAQYGQGYCTASQQLSSVSSPVIFSGLGLKTEPVLVHVCVAHETASEEILHSRPLLCFHLHLPLSWLQLLALVSRLPMSSQEQDSSDKRCEP
jgi:hypothetical protein